MASTPTVTGASTPNPNNHSPQHHHVGHHSGHHARRLMEFVRPNGRKVFIAHTPEDHLRLHRELSTKEPQIDFDVLISGTPEHLGAIRELRDHHEAQRDLLKATHGDIYDQFEAVKTELDTLSNELHMITNHGVALDANFSKYGYSAHLRTKDDSGSSTPGAESDVSSISKAQDRTAEPLKFWKQPTIRQYFHKGLLWRSSQSGEVASFELFVDLLYVGVIGVIGDTAAESATGKSLLEYIIIMCIGWKIWSDLTMVINWFDIDDIVQRISVLFYLACLFGFTTNIAYGFESTYTALIAFYLAQRMMLSIWFVWVAYQLPTIRATLIGHSIIMLISSALWVVSIHVEYPDRLAPIWLAVGVDVFGAIIIMLIARRAIRGGTVGTHLSKYFEFWPAINIEHRVERTNSFVTLVFGYSVLTILFQNKATFGVNAFFGKGILGLIQAFAFNWIYFEIDANSLHVHAIRRHVFSASVWVTCHLPFVMAYVLAAATLSKLVLASDCRDADPETLGEAAHARSETELPTSLRWFYCGGLGIALLSMTAISLSHIHKRLLNPRLKKRPRLFIRACVAIVIICLPLADKLSSLELISITCGLVVFVLMLDLYGNSCAGDEFWTGGFCPEAKRRCTYSANCKLGKRQRRRLEEALQKGENLTLAELLKDRSRNSSMSSLDSEKGLRDEGWHGGHY